MKTKTLDRQHIVPQHIDPSLKGWHSVGVNQCLLMWFDVTTVGEIMNREIHKASLDAMKKALSVPIFGFKVQAAFHSL